MGFLAALVLAQLLLQATTVTATVSESLFEPLEYLNITRVYDRYSAFIDLLIYVLIFVGLAQATLAHRYPGAGGRAVAIGVGLSLTIAMLIAEETFNFNLKSFGPFAATLIVLVLGVMTYSLLHNVGMARISAAASAYLAVFFGTIAVAPEFFQWLETNVPVLSAGLFVVSLVSLIAILSCLWPHQRPAHSIARRLKTVRPPIAGQSRKRRFLGKHIKAIKKRAKRDTGKTLRESQKLQADLKTLKRAIREYGRDPESRKLILQEMSRLTPQTQQLKRNIAKIKEFNEGLRKLDESVLHENLKARVRAVTPEAKAKLKKEIYDELQKLRVEDRIAWADKATKQRAEAISLHVSQAARLLNSTRLGEAIEALDKAIAEEKRVKGLARKIRAMEKRLADLAKGQLRTGKRIATGSAAQS